MKIIYLCNYENLALQSRTANLSLHPPTASFKAKKVAVKLKNRTGVRQSAGPRRQRQSLPLCGSWIEMEAPALLSERWK